MEDALGKCESWLQKHVQNPATMLVFSQHFRVTWAPPIHIKQPQMALALDGPKDHMCSWTPQKNLFLVDV
jgi:hypothetical protein